MSGDARFYVAKEGDYYYPYDYAAEEQ